MKSKQFKSPQRSLNPRLLIPKSPIGALRLVWLLAVLWFELGTFLWTLSGCRWPKEEGTSTSTLTRTPTTHVLLIADPQVRGPREQSAWRRRLHLTDVSLRKRWTFARRVRPDAIVFLGDMLDDGRYARNDEEYRESYEYFTSIFQTDPNTKVYYIPGNHDVGLSQSSKSKSAQARRYYTKYFGPLNDRISTGNHTLVMLDASGLVEEDYRRAKTMETFETWHSPTNGAIDFVNKFASTGAEEPVVLFSHIPLFRPDTAPCGPLREKGTIRRGVGPGFQNTLGRDTTNYILKNIRPSIVFSGNDHDYCEYMHSIPLLSEGPEPKIEYVREVTVKAISSASVRRPGFHLLSLGASTSQPKVKSFAEAHCFLPDEHAIYFSRYLPLFFLTLLVLAVSAIRKHRVKKQRPGSLDLDYEDDYTEGHTASQLSAGTGVQPQLSPAFGEMSPESKNSSFAFARSPRGMGPTTPSRATFAPTFRAAAHAHAPFTPHTPDFTVGGGTPSGLGLSQMLSVPSPMLSGLPARLRALSDTEDGDGDEEDLQSLPSRATRYRAGANGDDDYFGLTLDRARRSRRFAWAWSFELGGRRRRLNIGVPPLLEHSCRTFWTAIGVSQGGSRGMRGNKMARESVLKILLDDLASTAWPPFLLFSVIFYFLLK